MISYLVLDTMMHFNISVRSLWNHKTEALGKAAILSCWLCLFGIAMNDAVAAVMDQLLSNSRELS